MCLCPHHTTKRAFAEIPQTLPGEDGTRAPKKSGPAAAPRACGKKGFPFATLQIRGLSLPFGKGCSAPTRCLRLGSRPRGCPTRARQIGAHPPKRPFKVRAFRARGPPFFKGALRAEESSRTVCEKDRSAVARPSSGSSLESTMRPTPAGGRAAAPLVERETKKLNREVSALIIRTHHNYNYGTRFVWVCQG